MIYPGVEFPPPSYRISSGLTPYRRRKAVLRALAKDPPLPDAWWKDLNASLDALAAQHTRRIATPDTETATQDLVTRTITTVFPAPPTPRCTTGYQPTPTSTGPT